MTHIKDRVRILIVDDYPDSAESVAQWLELDGFETCTARDGTEALERAAAWRPHVCVMDLQMPRLDGFEVARRLRSLPWARKILLIAHTGHATREVRDRAYEAGFDQYFAKPAEPRDFLRAIHARTRTSPLAATDLKRASEQAPIADTCAL